MKRIVFFTLCVIAAHARGQSQWTLQECIGYARAHNIPLRQAALNNDILKYNSAQSRATMLPSVNAGVSHVYNVGKQIDRFTNKFADKQVLSQNFYLQGNLVLWSGFSQYNNSRAAEDSYRSSVEQVKQQEYDLALAVANAYINVIFADELLKISRSQRQVSQEQLERTKKMVAAGAMAKSSEFEIAAQLANEDANVITAENNSQLALLALRQIMNLDSVSNFNVKRPDIEVKENALLLGDVESTYQASLRTQPSIRSGEFAIRSAERRLQSSRGRAFPTLSMTGMVATGTSGLAENLEQRVTTQAIGITDKGDIVYVPTPELISLGKTPFSDQFKNNVAKSFGFQLNVPIFNGLQTHTAIKTAQISALNARLSQDLQKQNLMKSIAQAYADARAALNRYNANLLSVQAATEAFRYAQEKFNAGASSAFDFSNAKNRLFAAEGNLQQAKYDYVFRLKVLDFYQGKPLEF